MRFSRNTAASFTKLFTAVKSLIRLIPGQKQTLIVRVCVFEQFYGQSKVYSEVLDYLNMIFTGVFTIEFILKLYAFRIKVGVPGLAHFSPVFTKQLH